MELLPKLSNVGKKIGELRQTVLARLRVFCARQLPASRAGQSIIEILMAVALFALLAPALVTGYITAVSGKAAQQQRLQAATLAREAVEAVRVVRERGWSGVASSGVYHPVQTSTTWELASGAETIETFSRRIELSEVRRNAQGDIVLLGGSVDPSTKRVRVSVSWGLPIFSEEVVELYLTRYRDNLALVHTTVDDFMLPGRARENVDVTSLHGGALKLGVSGTGYANWCEPSVTTELDLPKNGEARALTAIQGQVFAGTGGNASGVSLAHVTLTNSRPPLASLGGTFTGYKTNDIFGEPGFAYIATDTNSSEVVIINTSTMTAVGTFDSPGSTDGVSVFVVGNVGFLAAGNRVYTFDLSSKVGSRPQLGTITLASTVKAIFVRNQTIYAALNSSSTQVAMINASNPAALQLLATVSLPAATGRDLFVPADERRLYVVTAASSTQRELFIVNIENKTAPTVISSYEANGMDPQAVSSIPGGNGVIIVGTGGEEYQVINTVPETYPERCGGLQVNAGIFDIDTVLEDDGDVFAYISTGDAAYELKVLPGGPGGSNSMSGWYESPFIDLGYSTAFNRLSIDADIPAGTSVSYQVAGAQPVGGSCAAAQYTFVGPDGTENTVYTESGPIPFSNDGVGFENPAQCVKYKVFLATTDVLLTPLIREIQVNYSP
jgi:type II secretory pathway pseudopilin PulG